MATTVAGMSKQQLARALGATGAAFGLVSVVAPRAVAGTYGVPVTPAGLQLQRLFGSRALAISVLALTARTDAEVDRGLAVVAGMNAIDAVRSEEHTSELQSRQYLVCRLLLEKKKKHYAY